MITRRVFHRRSVRVLAVYRIKKGCYFGFDLFYQHMVHGGNIYTMPTLANTYLIIELGGEMDLSTN